MTGVTASQRHSVTASQRFGMHHFLCLLCEFLMTNGCLGRADASAIDSLLLRVNSSWICHMCAMFIG